MQNDGPTGGGADVELPQDRGDMFVRQTVKTIAPYPLRVHLGGQRIHLCDFRICAVERGIEAGHL